VSAEVIPLRQVPRLDAAQRALAKSVPGLAERVASSVLADYGPLMPLNEAVREAHYGITLAAASYVEAPGSPFERWAAYQGCYAILMAARRERRPGRIRRQVERAVMGYYATTGEESDQALREETPEQLVARLRDFIEGAIGAAACGGVGSARQALGEEYPAAREAWKVTMEALGRVLRELRPEQLRLIEACYPEGEERDLKEAAQVLGMSYRTLLDHHTALVRLIGARMRGLRVIEVPENLDRELPGVISSTAGRATAPREEP
jgi:hypothetical protein